MDTTPRVKLSDEQAERLANALYPSAMDYCKAAMENTKKQEKESNQNAEKEKGND